MESVLNDLRYSLRLMRKNPVFTFVSILALAVGIGANTAIFSMVNAVLLRQLPFKNPEKLTWVWGTRVDLEKAFFSIPDYIDYRDQNHSLEEVAAFASWGANLTSGGDPERLTGVRMSANTFQMLGVEASLGRVLQPDDSKPDSSHTVVISYGLWQRRFGGNHHIVGTSLVLNGESYVVAGVLPQTFIFPGTEAELAIPLVLESDSRRSDRGANFLRLLARLKPDYNPQQAEADLNAITSNLRQLYPVTNGKHTAPRVVPLHAEIVGNYKIALYMLLGAIGLVLLIACSNLANLFLARASSRHKEMAIRAAMGASRARLIRQMLTETGILAVIGGAVGLLLAWRGGNLLMSLSPSGMPRVSEVNVDFRVLLFTLIVSAFAGVSFGLLPALQASKIDLNDELKSGGRGVGVQGHRSHARNTLVVTEVALSLVLLIGAGLLLKSLIRLQEVQPGFETSNLLLVRLSLPPGRYAHREALSQFFEKALPRLQQLPGVLSVSAANVMPLSAMRVSNDFTIVGRPPTSANDMPSGQTRWVSPGYFQNMGIPLLRGREFSEQDTAHSSGVVIVDEVLARRYWPNGNPVGAHLRLDDEFDMEIVGVVGNVKHFSMDEAPLQTLYAPITQIPEPAAPFMAGNNTIAIRTKQNPLTLEKGVRAQVQIIDAEVPTASVKTMEQFLETATAPRRFNVLLLTIFAVASLALAITGIYAVMSYSVSQRAQEIGVRMALGATPGDVLKLILGHGLKLVFIGVGIGLVGGFLMTRFISTLLYGVGATDPMTFILTSLLLMVIAMLACFAPALRATKLDPALALRAE